MFILGLSIETLIIVLLSVATGVIYHLATYADIGSLMQFVGFGLLVAALFEMPLVMHSHYMMEHDHAGRRSIGRMANAWAYAFMWIALIALLTKTGDQLSRGWLLMFFVVGLGGTLSVEVIARHLMSLAESRGISVAVRRLAVIGTAAEIERFRKEQAPSVGDLEIVSAACLPDGAWAETAEGAILTGHLDGVLSAARREGVSDVVILSDWSRSDLAMKIAHLFLDLPVAVHLGQIGAIEHFPSMRVVKLGSARTLVLRSEPLSMFQSMLKRFIDIVASAFALVCLAPLFVAVAIAIKLDSSGPVFFLQRRRGYNLKEFRIWKFRTMTTLDDGDVIVQAKKDDTRVTRLGRLMRRYNIDELPQLINVLLGEMSLVGPRPHAVAHDMHYEQVIARYSRRLNVKPGITGWAQVNGFRGATEDDSAMLARVVHDIEYIDRWSVGLDFYIMLMTVCSPGAYKNAH